MKIKYYENDINKGIIYDWDHIEKEYRKLKCPKQYWYPLKCDFRKARYSVALSDRSRGKTTNPSLVALIMYRDYGTVMHYVRNSKEECEPKIIRDMYDTIKEHHYIEKIFDGKWNNIYYYGKRWYLCYVDDEGQILERDPEPCTVCFGIDENDKLKSTYNCPRGDIIIYDEFIATIFGYSDAVRFLDLMKTIFRDRLSGYIWMLSNTINLHSPWFDELMIREGVNGMKAGECKYIELGAGKPTYHVELIEPDQSEHRSLVNSLIFGIPNPRFASITGSAVWAMEEYQHIPAYSDYDPDTRTYHESEPEMLFGRLYLEMSKRIVRLQLVINPDLGVCVYVVPATRIYDDSFILTCGDIKDKRYIFAFGKGTFCDTIWELYRKNMFFYATNSEGALIKGYINLAYTKLKAMGG